MPDPEGTAPERAPDPAPDEERPAESEWQVRRVLVALDASPASAAAATTAAELAAALSAELAGLFVEDTALARLTDLPTAAEVGTHTGTPRPLARDELLRRLRAQAARARRMLESSAARVELEARLEVVRGSVAAEVVTAAGELELLSLGRVGTSSLARLGSVARAALVGGRGPLLLLSPGGGLARPVVVAYGDTAEARRALTAAIRLAGMGRPAAGEQRPGGERQHGRQRRQGGGRRASRSPVVLIPAGGEAAAWLANEARNRFLEAGIEPRIRRVSPAQHHALAHAAATEGAGTLVLPVHSPLASGAEVEAVVEVLDCAVMLVR